MITKCRYWAKRVPLEDFRLQYLVKEGMPREGRGKYDPVKCMLWYVRYLQGLLEKGSVPRGDCNLVGERAERVRLLRANADMREIELAQKRSQLITVADAKALVTELVVNTTSCMMSVAPRLAPELVGETSRIMIQAKIEKAFKDALSALAKTGSSGSAVPQ